MRNDQQQTLVKRILDLMDKPERLPPGEPVFERARNYTSRAHLQRELRCLFKSRAQLITLSCRLPHPGDYFTDDMTGTPVLLIRGDDGRVRAFLNACRHRAARLVEGSGSRKAGFSCPYHGWTYDRQGSLRRVMPPHAFGNLPCESLGLIPLPVIESRGLIYVVPAPGEAIPPSPLGTLEDEIAQYQLESFHHFQTAVLRPNANWKLVIDGFLENWHFDILHRNTIAPLFVSSLVTVDDFAPTMRVVYPRKSIETVRRLPHTDNCLLPHAVVIYVVFPNVLVLWQGDHLEIWRVFPDPNGDPGRCLAEASLYAPEPVRSDKARDHWQRNWDLLMQTVVEEDFPLAERVQANLTTGIPSYLLFGGNEPALQLYHGTISAMLGSVQGETARP